MKMNRKNPYGDIGRENYWQTVRRRFLHHRLACISLVVLAVICTAAILAPVIAPYDPDAIAGPFGAPPGRFMPRWGALRATKSRPAQSAGTPAGRPRHTL